MTEEKEEFSRFSSPPKLTVIEGGKLGKKPYKAYGVDAPSNRPSILRVEYQTGMVSLLSRSFLTEIMCTSHQALAFLFTNFVITLEGERLDLVLEAAFEEKLLSIHCYHPERHELGEEDAPMITKIKREGWSDWVLRTSK